MIDTACPGRETVHACQRLNMEDSEFKLPAETHHCLDFVSANADGNIRKSAHKLLSTPLIRLSETEPENAAWRQAAKTVRASRSVISFTTLRSSFDLWASLGHLENLLSDYRRIAPRFTFLQLAGEAGIAAGNEYRLTLTDPKRLAGLDTACKQMAPDQDSVTIGDKRAMDLRVTRAGPWGGETGELVVEALENHALAGASSLWLVAHGETEEGSLQITLDTLEISRWAWAPDFVAQRDTGDTGDALRILNWHYLFERLIQELDGTPEPAETSLSFDRVVSPFELGHDRQIAEALRSHTPLSPLVRQVQTQENAVS